MNILIVEDSDAKAANVETCLRNALQSGDVVITRARSYQSAIKSLTERAFDLLVLDLALPTRDGGSASLNGGHTVVTEIVEGDECRKPSHIVCLTEFDAAIDDFSKGNYPGLVHFVLYKETDTAWQQSLQKTALYVFSRVKEAASYPIDYAVDLAIVTSSPLVELIEVTKLPGTWVAEYNQSDKLHYYSTSWISASGKTLKVVACAAPRMGMTAATICSCKVIERWRPRYLVMTGIAAGTKKDDLQFGDIIAAEAAFDYGSGKIIETKLGERTFVPSPHQIDISPKVHAVLQKWEREQTGMDSIRLGWPEPFRNTPKLVLGLMASGAAVVQSKALVDEILSASRKTMGLEMEAYGVLHAAFLASDPQPEAFVVKSVADFADHRKDNKWQRYAAYTSAKFVYQLFTKAPEL